MIAAASTTGAVTTGGATTGAVLGARVDATGRLREPPLQAPVQARAGAISNAGGAAADSGAASTGAIFRS